ncbi:MAG: ATP phosphoribosyltransferase [Firmicutes bacterium]|nr:ATP phosphoribosyltransferase [Bacillota bacterium]
MIRIALTKGRIESESLKLLEAAGYDCSELDCERRGRKLLFRLGDADIEIVLAKAADVITYVEHGVCDAGVVGKDTIMEQGRSFYELLDLGFGKCRFALAGPAGRNFYSGYGRKVVASKYPNVAKAFFNSRGEDVEVVKIEGSVELAPLLGLSGAIVDIVETGSTLKANGLEVYETIAEVSARFIVNVAAMKLKKSEIDVLTARLTEVVNKKSEATNA